MKACVVCFACDLGE